MLNFFILSILCSMISVPPFKGSILKLLSFPSPPPGSQIYTSPYLWFLVKTVVPFPTETKKWGSFRQVSGSALAKNL